MQYVFFIMCVLFYIFKLEFIYILVTLIILLGVYDTNKRVRLIVIKESSI